jgi:hypothetical protein
MRATLLGNGDRERLTLPSPLARARESHFYSTGAAREAVGNSEPRKRRSPTRSLSITTSHGLPSTGEATDYLLEARPPASVGSIFDFLLERRRFDRPAAASTRLRRLPGRTDATSRPRRGSQAATNQLLQRLAAATRDLYDVGEGRRERVSYMLDFVKAGRKWIPAAPVEFGPPVERPPAVGRWPARP